jgi:hypothetical protein
MGDKKEELYQVTIHYKDQDGSNTYTGKVTTNVKATSKKEAEEKPLDEEATKTPWTEVTNDTVKRKRS